MVVTKITDLILTENLTFSFEVTAAVPQEKLNDLTVKPVFFAITWHASSLHLQKGSLDIGPLNLATYLRSKGEHVLLHLTCESLRKPYLDSVLKFLKDKEICNLFTMLGESYQPEESDFKSTKELIEYIRSKTGVYFCIGVAGFPDHTEEKLAQLKAKVDSGADFIVTQAFFEFTAYKNFVSKCRDLGIDVPILPGLFVYENHKELVGFTNACGVKVSKNFLEHVKNNKTDVSKEVKDLAVKIVDSKLSSGHLHFFTLNKLDKVSNLMKNWK